MKSSNRSSGSMWTIVCLLVVGFSLGIWLSLVVLSSLEHFTKDSFLKSPTNSLVASPSSVDESSLTRFTTTTVDAEWIDPQVLTKQEVKELLSPYTTNTKMLDAFLKTEQEVDDARQMISSGIQSEVGDELSVQNVIEGVWKVGIIATGEPKGSIVYLIKTQYLGGPYSVEYRLFVQRDGISRLEILESENTEDYYSDISSGDVYSFFHFARYVISSLPLPDRLELENGKFILGNGKQSERIAWDVNGFYPEVKSLVHVVATTKDGRKVYALNKTKDHPDVSGCLYVFDVVGRAHVYSSNIMSQTSGLNEGQAGFIQWDVPMPKDIGYETGFRSGCGETLCTSIVESLDIKTLRQVGKTYDDQPVYSLKDFSNNQGVEGLYDMWLTMNPSKPPIDEFLKQHPIPYFYWKDALGRWVIYHDASAQPQAECGKPVIYLYPTTSTQVSVKLPGFINVTVSDPQYPVNGWNVTANPNGDLVSRDDGKVYGSLYWEGTGVGYQPPKTGFVVKDGEVSSFLAKTLPKYGLNQNETKEFMDFWVPRMVGAPYYQISFLTSEWSKVAPLNVTPRPQTNIRIFMDWKPLSRSKSIKAPSIVTPVRNGFTLVEWGGLLYK